MSATLTFRPTGTTYQVRLCQAPEQSSGGVWLPDNYRDNFTEAEVLAAGPGLRFDSLDETNVRTVMWAQPGEFVLFQKNSFVPFSMDGREGTVKDEELVAVARLKGGTEVVEPLNDWVRVRPCEAEPLSSVIETPDFWRRAARKGVVEDLGPGRLRLTGKIAGRRVPICRELGLKKVRDLIGKTVRWGENAAVLDVGGEGLECVLVRASDLLWIEEEDEKGGPNAESC